MTSPAQASRRPDLECRAIPRRRYDAEQSQLTLTTSHDAAQRRSARRLAATVIERHAQLGAEAAQSQATMLDGEEGQLAFAPELTREHLCFRRTQRGLGTLQQIIAHRPQAAGGLIASRHDAGGHPAPCAWSQRQLPQ